MKKKILIGLSLFGAAAMSITACGNKESSKTGTARAVEEASKMTLAQLAEASKKEWEKDPNGTMNVVGLTSVLRSVATSIAEKYEWLNYTYDKTTKTSTGNISVNNSYKDYQLLAVLPQAENTYFADYALAQDVRSFSTLMEDGITHNFVPSDTSAVGLPEVGKTPLYGVHFNKLFWTNTNFEHVNGFRLYNIWQVAGTSADHDHCDKVSFQSPTTEQINMSFLLTAYAEENQARIEAAYKSFYGKDWEPTTFKDGNITNTYRSAGDQWVREFIANISRFHTSDGTAMKQTQLRDDWNEGYVYYGAFAKMKDAVGNTFNVDLDGNGAVEAKAYSVECGGVTYNYASEENINAMTTVKWDWAIEGFNGFMYCMDSQIINNARYPYTACLFARTMLEEDVYTNAIYNAGTPDATGAAANQYGYYYPGQTSADFKYAKGDWTKEQHTEKELNEDYEYLKNVKISSVNTILMLVNSNKKA